MAKILDVEGKELWGDDSARVRDALVSAVAARANLAGAVLMGANLGGANLTRANIGGADLTGANLAGANLADAVLAGAYLARANLAGANLTGVNLSDAYLTGAYLAHANLADANLAGANLSGANLAGAYLARANLIIDLGCPDGWPAFAWLRDGVCMVQVGCRLKTIAEGREYWRGKNDRREVLVALDYAEAVATLRGWGIERSAEDVR